MGLEFRHLLFILVLGICCNSDASEANTPVAKQQFVALPRSPFLQQQRLVFPVYQPLYYRPVFFSPFAPRRRTNSGQTSAMQLAMFVLLRRILNSRDAGDTGSESDAPEPTIECQWGQWGSCSLSTSSCGIRRRVKKCNGDTEVQSESCDVPTGFRTLPDGNWYRAANCYEYFVPDDVVARRSDGFDDCSALGGILASKGMRDDTLRTDIVNQFTPGDEIFIGLQDGMPVEGDFIWDDGETTVPNFFSATSNNQPFRDCFTIITGDAFSVSAKGCGNDFRYLCERPTSA